MADDDDDEETINFLKSIIGSEATEMFLESAQEVVALVTAADANDVHSVNDIMDQRACCPTHMGFLTLGVLAFCNQILDSYCDNIGTSVPEFLQQHGLRIASAQGKL